MVHPRNPVNKIRLSDVDALALASENLPAIVKPPPEYGTSRQAVARIYVRLVFLMEERNYDYSDLADYLESGLGLKLTPVTVRKYMNAIKKERRQSKRTVKSPESPIEPSPGTPIVEPVPIVSPPLEATAVAAAAAPLPPPETEITSAIVEAPSPEIPPKSSLRPGEWSPAELRKHFNKY
jgi:hypothetical protein